jgi:1-acyl-sn-glycerol-3-phosphate acyltransferase
MDEMGLSMNEMFVRSVKGAFMGIMFGTFFLGMMVILFFVLPLKWLSGRLFGKEEWFEKFVRKGFGSWLQTLGYLGLVKANRPAGAPYDGPCVVVCNHPGLFDVLFLIRYIPRLSVMVKYSLSRTLPLGSILRALEYILVPDYETVTPLDTAEKAIEKIKADRKLQVFPEGTRSPLGGLRHFRAGAFKIARMSEVPVQPVLIRNDPPFLPKEDRWYYPRREASRLEMEFWEPIVPPEKGKEREFARDLEDRYRRALGLDKRPRDF